MNEKRLQKRLHKKRLHKKRLLAVVGKSNEVRIRASTACTSLLWLFRASVCTVYFRQIYLAYINVPVWQEFIDRGPVGSLVKEEVVRGVGREGEGEREFKVCRRILQHYLTRYLTTRTPRSCVRMWCAGCTRVP
jgi:hypothetical protein